MGLLEILSGQASAGYQNELAQHNKLQDLKNQTLFDVMTEKRKEQRLEGAMGEMGGVPGPYMEGLTSQGTGLSSQNPQEVLRSLAQMTSIDPSFSSAFTGAAGAPAAMAKMSQEQVLENQGSMDRQQQKQQWELDHPAGPEEGDNYDFVEGAGAGTQKVTMVFRNGQWAEAGRGSAFRPTAGGAGGAGLNQEEIENAARKIVAGESTPSDFGKRRGTQLAIALAVEKISPGFNLNAAEANTKYRRLSTNLSGLGMSTAVIPLFDKLRESGKALGNSKIPMWNKMVNATKEQLGRPEIVAFNNLRDDMVAEAERVLMGTGVLSDSKYNRALHNMNSSLNYEQLDAALDNMEEVINANLEARKGAPYKTVKDDTEGPKVVNWSDL